MRQQSSVLGQLWSKADTPGVRAFFLSITALGVALLLAVYSGAAAELGNIGLAASSALLALAIAGWVAVTLVPTLARRTPLRWIGYKIDYKISRAGWVYIGATLLVALAALNTGNNLLFLILSCLVAVILMSGILSSISLAGVELRIEVPEHIFAGQTVRVAIELRNEKLTLPSFGLRVEGVAAKGVKAAALLETPAFFPYLPKREAVRQSVPVTFVRRGVHVQDAFRVATRFPFGFLQKTRQVSLKSEVLVYPPVDAESELVEMFAGIEGILESYSKGRGQDLHALREYVPTDSARHVHWKASARMGSLMVREFAREEDCRVLLVLDPYAAEPGDVEGAKVESRFERAVNLCAGIAWHFSQRNAQLEFRGAGIETPLAPAEENIFAILRYLATAQPQKPGTENTVLHDLASSTELFKIIITSRARGTIPADLWHSSYVIFLESLQEQNEKS